MDEADPSSARKKVHMLQYSLVIFATLGLAMTLIAMLGLVLVAGLRWALVEGRWSRTRADALVVNLRSGLARGRWLARLLTRGLWPAGRGYRS
jgi:hypothetical protein